MNSKKKIFFFIILSFLLILEIPFLITAINESNSDILYKKSLGKVPIIKSSSSKCVMDATIERKECIKISQQNHKDCLIEVREIVSSLKLSKQNINTLEILNMRFECSNELKEDKRVCKLNFNTSLCN